MRKKLSVLAMIGALFGFQNRKPSEKPQGYEFHDKADEPEAEILLYGPIGEYWDGVTAKQFAQDLKSLNGKDVAIRFNSIGGSVFDGAAMYNQVAQYSGNVTVYIDGMALSIASVIAMAGKKVKMAENAWLMVHKPSVGAWGDSTVLREQADLLDRLQENTLLPAYRNKTGKPDDELNKLVNEETWLSAAQALELGFVDEVIEAANVSASVDLTAPEFSNAPTEFLAQFGAVRPPKKPAPPAPDNANPPAGPAAPETPEAPTNNQPPAQDPAPEVPAPQNAAEVERARVDGIMDLCTSHNLPIASAQKWIRNNTTLQQARDFAFELAAARDEATTVNSQIPGGGGGGKNPLIEDAQRRAAAAR